MTRRLLQRAPTPTPRAPLPGPRPKPTATAQPPAADRTAQPRSGAVQPLPAAVAARPTDPGHPTPSGLPAGTAWAPPSRSTSPTPTGGTPGAAPPAAAPSAATRASTQSQLSAARALRAGDTALPPRQHPTARLQHRQARWADPDLGQRTAEGRGTGALLLPRFNTRTCRGLAPKAKPALRTLLPPSP